MTPGCLAQGGNSGWVTTTFPLPLPDPAVACTQGECLDPPLSKDPRCTPPAPASPGLAGSGQPLGRTTEGEGPRHSPAPRAVQRPRPGQKRRRGLQWTAPPTGRYYRPISTCCGPLRPRPWGSVLPNQKERLARQANQKLAKRARRGKRAWPRMCCSRRGQGLMASRKHQ